MKFVDFEGTNHSFGKPSNMADDQCGTLKVKMGIATIPTEQGEIERFAVSTSAWKPDEQDLKRLNEGSLIYLNVFGHGHPVVSVSTELIETEPIN